MLNEFHELRQYLCSLPETERIPAEERRLKYGTLAADLGKSDGTGTVNALPRPLTVIARAVLWAPSLKDTVPELRLRMAECAMKAWLGLELDMSPVIVDEKDTPVGSPEPGFLSPDARNVKPMADTVQKLLQTEYGITGQLECWFPIYCTRVVFREKACELLALLVKVRERWEDEPAAGSMDALIASLRRTLSKLDSHKGAGEKDLTALADTITVHEDVLRKVPGIRKSDALTQAKKSALLSSSLSKKKNVFSYRMFTSSVKAGETNRNTFNQVTYEKILADAMEQGPLRAQYLACDPLWTEGVCTKTVSGKQKGFDDGDLDILLKSVAAFLLRRFGGQNDAKIEQVDLANWSQKKGKTAAVSETLRDRFAFSEKTPLFEISCDGAASPEFRLNDRVKDGILQYFSRSKEDPGQKPVPGIPQALGEFYLAGGSMWKKNIICTEDTADQQRWQRLIKAICLCLYHDNNWVPADYAVQKEGKRTKTKPILGEFHPDAWFVTGEVVNLFDVKNGSDRRTYANYTKLYIEPAFRDRFRLISAQELIAGWNDETASWSADSDGRLCMVYGEDPAGRLLPVTSSAGV